MNSNLLGKLPNIFGIFFLSRNTLYELQYLQRPRKLKSDLLLDGKKEEESSIIICGIYISICYSNDVQKKLYHFGNMFACKSQQMLNSIEIYHFWTAVFQASFYIHMVRNKVFLYLNCVLWHHALICN